MGVDAGCSRDLFDAVQRAPRHEPARGKITVNVVPAFGVLITVI
jgi:hypothetical protein